MFIFLVSLSMLCSPSVNLSPGVATAVLVVVRKRGLALTTGASEAEGGWTSATAAERVEVAKLRKKEVDDLVPCEPGLR